MALRIPHQQVITRPQPATCLLAVRPLIMEFLLENSFMERLMMYLFGMKH